jgi:hypothetical protein
MPDRGEVVVGEDQILNFRVDSCQAVAEHPGEDVCGFIPGRMIQGEIGIAQPGEVDQSWDLYPGVFVEGSHEFCACAHARRHLSQRCPKTEEH